MNPSKKRRNQRTAEATRNATKRRTSENVDKLLSDDSPVLIQHIQYGEQSVPNIPLNPDLDTLLYPMKATLFLDKYLRQQAVHITCQNGFEDVHANTRVGLLCQEMCKLNVEDILRETSSDNIFLWLRQRNDETTGKKKIDGRTSSPTGDLIRSIEIADVDTAIALHKIAGHATYCRAPPRVEQSLVSNLLRATGLGCGQYDPSGDSTIAMARGEVETFVSTPGHVTNWHFDFQENFTIQLSGIKRWTIQQGTIQDPIRGCTPHYAAPEAVESQLKAAHLFDRKFRFGHPETGVNATGKIVSIDVKPGDVFYFPAGMWHKVETIEPGVSINISLMANNYAMIVGQAIQHFLCRFDQWRQPVLQNTSHDVIRHLNGLLQSLPEQLRGMSNAEYIIPPILQNAPTFSTAGIDNDKDVNEMEGENTVDLDVVQSDADDDDEDDDSTEEELLVEEEEEEVIDPREYDNYPDGWDVGFKEDTKIVFRRNPLALLHRMDEIKNFYHSGRVATKEDGSSDGVFVLNVNYAGNEMHQSAVRVVFCDSERGFVNKLHALLECSDTEGASRDTCHREIRLKVSAVDFDHVKFLIYHGYISACL